MIRRAAGVVLLALGAGCAPADSPDDGAADQAGFVLRPGDSLFDHLDRAEVVAWPETNLPAELAELARQEHVRLALPPVPREAWGKVRNIPPEWVTLLETVGEFSLWRTPLPGPPVTADGPAPNPAVSVGGEPAPEWTPGSGPPPGTVAWWDAHSGALLALSVQAPLMVAVVRDVPAAAAWDGLEGAARPTGPTVLRESGMDLLGSAVVDRTRPMILAPAPSILRWSLDAIEAETLEYLRGRLLRGWVVRDGVLHRAGGQGDGVRFAVEIRDRPDDAEEAREAPFTRLVESGPAQVERTLTGGGWVSLRDWRGRPVELQLVTEPVGDAVGDYALWGDLHVRGGAEREPERPHVVLIDLDTLRADRLGAYAERGLTPRIDAWAAGATVFEDALAPASWTLPSTVSMFTGLAVHQHGITRGTQALGAQVPTLATRLDAAGYETRGLNSGGYLRPTFGLDEGFDVYDTTRDPKHVDWSEVLADLARRDSERPQFVMLHTYFVHAPYDHDPAFAGDYAGRFAGQPVDYPNVLDPFRDGELALSDEDGAYVEAMYDALVARLDDHLGGFLEELDAALDGQPSLVIVTSDHGEAFLEHDLLGHGEALWDELLRVPLIVRFPDGRAGRDARPASLVDIVPTVLDVVGLEVPEGLAGQSLASPAPGGPPRVRVAALDDGQRATASEGFSLLEVRPDGPARLYETRSDPGQTRDLAAEQAERVSDLARRRRWFEETFPAIQAASDALDGLSAADREQLQALGYIGDDDPR